MVEPSEISVADISPPSYRVFVFDRKGTPVKNKTFAVSVDGRKERAVDTDDGGLLKIAPPKSTVKIILKTPGETGDDRGADAPGPATPSA